MIQAQIELTEPCTVDSLFIDLFLTFLKTEISLNSVTVLSVGRACDVTSILKDSKHLCSVIILIEELVRRKSAKWTCQYTYNDPVITSHVSARCQHGTSPL